MIDNPNIRIAKNSLTLYVRMFITLIVSLYTSRVVLSVLGAEDFGIYNIVGGVVVLFSFLTNAMTASTQRYLNYNIGLKDDCKVLKVFSVSILAHFTILLLALLLSETFGLWFVLKHLNIPIQRQDAVLYVYQLSVFVMLVQIMVVPYRASIIAAEKMSILAAVSIIEVVLKLIVSLMVSFGKEDKLVLYSFLLAVVNLIVFLIYRIICNRRIRFTRFSFIWDKALYKELISFSGWYLFGGLAMVGSKQGVNILINLFFNVTVNAAVGISNQVKNAVYSFVTSFQTAFNPQIVKLYASGETKQLINLIYKSSKYSFYLLFIISFPIILYTKEILSIWLVEVPSYAVIFSQLTIIASFTEALSTPLWTAIGATGNVKKYQFYVSMILCLEIPVVYIAFKLGLNPTAAFWIILIMSLVALIYRLIYIKKFIQYSVKEYLSNVIFPCTKVILMAIPIPLGLRLCSDNIITTIVYIFITILITVCSVLFCGITKHERNFIYENFIKKIKR